MAMSEILIMTALLFLGLLVPVAAEVGQTKEIAWISFAVFIVLFIGAAIYVRHRRATRSRRGPANGSVPPPAAVSAWGKAAPPTENGKAGFGQSVATGAWERDA